MAELTSDDDGPAVLLRTDYSDDEAWERVREAALTPAPLSDDDGDLLEPTLRPVSDRRFDGWGPVRVANGDVAWPDFFVVLADARSMSEDPPTYAVVSLAEEDDGRSFRAAQSELASIEANLSLANLDFADFADNTDDDGVFRGFA